MKLWQVGAIAGLMGFAAVPVLADNTEVLYRYKSWMVEGITFDDGSIACLAEVTDPGESFSVWIFPDKTIRLQFYSADWDFGDSDTANLEVEIDHRSPWSLTNANLTKNSVLFDLPDQDESVNFVLEVAKGSNLHLRSESGEGIRDYSLAGSSSSIQNLIDCGNSISGSTKNPFK
ncbi:MAG: hypothetical protein ABIV25_03330 [Paracoccaceae bacterium]